MQTCEFSFKEALLTGGESYGMGVKEKKVVNQEQKPHI